MSGRPATTSVIPGRYAISVGDAGMPAPKGWSWTSLSKVARLETGHTPSRSRPEYWEGGDIGWIGIKDARLHHGKRIHQTLQKVTQAGIDNSASRKLPAGTVCLSRTASVGYVFVMGREMATSQDFVNWVCSEALVPEFLMYALIAEGEDIRRFGKGTTHTTIYFPEVKAFHLCLPPIAEQRRIVVKIEELFSDLDAGEAALTRAKLNLKRYRASVLKAAVEGHLTAAWRAEHPGTEPASTLLARILTERRQKWEADQLAKFAAAGMSPPKNWRDKYVEPLPHDAPGLAELPKSWCWASVQQVGSVQLGRQRAPQHHKGAHMRPYLRVANVFEDRIDISDVMEMNFTPDEFETYRLGYGDILLNEGQSMELVGRPAMYRDEVPGACFTNTLVRFRAHDGVNKDYALKVFLAYLKSGRFQKIATITVNIAHLGAGRFSEIEFPLPPVAEQAAIIEEVDRHFSLIDAAESAINAGLARAARLRQSILKQAFEGKLVAQDHNDEPASALLARIQEQAAKSLPEAASTTRGPLRLPKEIFWRRASVVSYTVRKLASQPSFGRTQLEKTVHLTQCHLGVDMGFHFERYAAGPFDKDIYRLEAIAKKKDWFTTQQRPKYGVTYHPGAKINDMCQQASGLLGPKQADLDRLLDHIAEMNTDEAELFATAYAAWNDLLIDGRTADDDAIIAEVHGWHPEKAKFTPQMIRSRLKWMRKEGYVPAGQGQRTQVIAKETKLKPRRRKTR